VSVQVSVEVRFDAKVTKNRPGRQAGFLRKLRHFNGIVHLRGALREQEVGGSNPPAPMNYQMNALPESADSSGVFVFGVVPAPLVPPDQCTPCTREVPKPKGANRFPPPRVYP